MKNTSELKQRRKKTRNTCEQLFRKTKTHSTLTITEEYTYVESGKQANIKKNKVMEKSKS